MPIDAYSICPGGTGKKMKFCCPDLVPELDKIDRMLDGEQYQGALRHIERLEQQGRPRQCLMAVKAELLRATGKIDEAKPHVAKFVEQFPENPAAWAESAIIAGVTESARDAVPKLQRAIALSGREMQPRVFNAISIISDLLIHDGDWAAGRALLHLEMTLVPNDSQTLQRIIQLNRSPEIPLLLKAEPPLARAPEDAPWKSRFEEAIKPLQQARWQEAVEKLEALAQDVPDSPAIWQDLAILRGWLADDEGAVEAYRKLASLGIPLEDAVEAEATAMMLSKDPLGDALDLVRLTWEVRDPDRFQEAMLSDRRAVQMPFDPATLADEQSPPPRLIVMLLDRPMPESAEGATLDTMPNYLGQALFFGRQTDREARVEVLGMTAWDVEPVTALLRQVAGDALAGDPQVQVTQQISASHQILGHRWFPPRGVTPEQAESLTAQQQRIAILEKWPQLPLGIFGGKSAQEAAADPANQVRLLAAVMVLEHWNDRSPVPFDFNELRGRLGLPLMGPIDPTGLPIDAIPIPRLVRVMVEKLSDEDLLQGFRRAMLFGASKAMRKFAQQIVERPSLAERPERSQAYNVLAQTAESPEQAIEHIEEGRREALAAGRSCASWDLLELTYRFASGRAREALALVQHIESRHYEEPGVARALTQVLVDVGLLRPDGTPAVPTRGTAATVPEQLPGAEAPADAGRLWTPGGETPGGGGGKLWTPG